MTDAYAEWKGWAEADFGRFSPLDASYFQWHVSRALQGQTEGLQVLELGFGNGRFAGWVASRGGTMTGVETNERLVAVARGRGVDAFDSLQAVPAGKLFDLVAGFDVLEHVPRAELEDLLQQLAGRLQPGGAMLFRFPNAESPFGLHLQHGDLTHVSALGASAMRQLCARTGLQLAHTGDLPPWRAFPPSRRVGALFSQGWRRTVEWQLRKAFKMGRGVDLAPNQTVVLRLPG